MVFEHRGWSPAPRLLRGAGVVVWVALAALALPGTLTAGEGNWRAYLAPAGACHGAEDAAAAAAVQRRAIRCLVNWARARGAAPQLAPSRALRRAATIKGVRIAACGQLSHAPCDTDLTAAVRASGYRFSSFGENLFATPRLSTSARAVVAAWLRSPSHRRTLLDPAFRELGAARVDAPRLLGERRSIVWVTALAAPG